MRVDDGASTAPYASSDGDELARTPGTTKPDRVATTPFEATAAQRLRPQRPMRRVHASSVVIVTIGLALTLALAVVAQVNSDDAATRLLDSQLRQLSTAPVSYTHLTLPTNREV